MKEAGELAGIVKRIARVQELCEAFARPEADRSRFLVTFADGDSMALDEVISQGRNALASIADMFEVTLSPAAKARGDVHAG